MVPLYKGPELRKHLADLRTERRPSEWLESEQGLWLSDRGGGRLQWAYGL